MSSQSKGFNFNEVQLINCFSFIAHTSSVICRNLSPNSGSPRPCIVCYLLVILLSGIYIEVYNTVWVTFCQRREICVYILSVFAVVVPVDLQLIHHPFFKRLSFLQWTTAAPLSQSSWLHVASVSLGSLFFSTDLCVHSVPTAMLVFTTAVL